MVAGRTPDPHMGLQPVRKGAAQHHVTQGAPGLPDARTLPAVPEWQAPQVRHVLKVLFKKLKKVLNT